jgi:hypothetical protein
MDSVFDTYRQEILFRKVHYLPVFNTTCKKYEVVMKFLQNLRTNKKGYNPKFGQ